VICTPLSLVAVQGISRWPSQLPVISNPSGAGERRVAISFADRLFSKTDSNLLSSCWKVSTKNSADLIGSVWQIIDKLSNKPHQSKRV
jgi:hypothetical protein